MDAEVSAVLISYGLTDDSVRVSRFGSGHINLTYLIESAAGKYILQNINTRVFTQPQIIAGNVEQAGEYLNRLYPEYLFIRPIKTLDGSLMAVYEEAYWRLLPYVENSVAFDTLDHPDQAFEAAVQFGRLSKLLAGFDVNRLGEPIPSFHDLGLRYTQFTEALGSAPALLKERASTQIDQARNYVFILDYYNSYKNSKNFPDRVMHHDTKISNMLFDKDTHKGICVIDLDTLMPGKFISDLGDMMRTYLCAFSENEPDPDKIFIRQDYFEAIIQGYLQEMGGILTGTEKDLLLFSGKYIIYMQALRFLTDYLKGNVYYPTSYPEQNLDRTINQFKLLSEIFKHEPVLSDIIVKCLNQNRKSSAD